MRWFNRSSDRCLAFCFCFVQRKSSFVWFVMANGQNFLTIGRHYLIMWHILALNDQMEMVKLIGLILFSIIYVMPVLYDYSMFMARFPIQKNACREIYICDCYHSCILVNLSYSSLYSICFPAWHSTYIQIQPFLFAQLNLTN